MNFFKHSFGRTYQSTFFVLMAFLNIKEPKVIKGEDSSLKIYEILKKENVDNVLVVVDEGLFKVPFTADIIDSLQKNGIKVSVFHDFSANPTIKAVEGGLAVYKANGCKGIIGLGGGSSMDAAKAIGARVVNPKKSVEKMEGLLKVGKKLPLLIAVPTTAGTGSETTVAAVITNGETHHKYPINDPKLVPIYAVLDPKLLLKLPPHITSTTGMDALTHAVEAYTNLFHTKRIKRHALEATKLIYENLYESYLHPDNLELRNNMQIAAYKAGVAFTNAYVGNVHAIAHALGGAYNVPHGLANSLILPVMLKDYGKTIYGSCARIYDYINMGDKNISKKEKTEKFIAWIEDMNKKMNIVSNFETLIKDEDVPKLSGYSHKEAFPLYPTPRMYSKKEFERLYQLVKHAK